MPALPIERGRPGPGLITHVVVSKFCDHIPLHRQAGISLRQGVELDRSTPADWVGQALFLLAPLADAVGRHVRAGVALHADDTTVPVFSPGLGKTKKGCLWVAVRDERPWGSDVPPAAFYRYSADRKGIHVEALLGAYRGFLHADGYGGFTRFYKPTTPLGDAPLIEVACWSHARRHFYDVHHQTGSPRRRRRSPSMLSSKSRRSSPSKAISADNCLTVVPPRGANTPSPCWSGSSSSSKPGFSGSAARAPSPRPSATTLSRWTALTRYVTDGRLEISNNAAERAMKPPVLGRKNYLFCGSDAGGQRAACMYTIVQTCKMNGINPQAYLTDVIGKIADHPIQKVDELLPWRWKP